MIGLCLGTGSYFDLNQSGITTARRNSWIVIPRARASSIRRVYVCSPKATMTLYDVLFHALKFSNIQTDHSNTYTVCMTGARHIRITEDPPENSPRIPSVPAPTSRVFRTKKWNGALERPRLDPETFVSGGEGSLFEMRHFEEWRKSCFHGFLCLNAELFEAFSAERAVFELATVSLFCEPFSTVPTLHYCCNTHFYCLTSVGD